MKHFPGQNRNRFPESIRLLYRQTFLLERTYDRKSKRYQTNPEFYQCNQHLEFIRSYFAIMGIEVVENSQLGLIYIRGEQVVGEKLSKLATLYVLILKLIYDEQMSSVSTSVNVVTTLSEINEKIGSYRLLKRQPSVSDIREPGIPEKVSGHRTVRCTGRSGRFQPPCHLSHGQCDPDGETMYARCLRHSAKEKRKMENQRFEALSRICLNNWHYIKHRTLSFDDGINFFTGHSGSGKSTVIDAMQIVLYANTDGRGFFNKAAADDSDRSLIEYLRGMINIGEDNSFSYLRNQNFSSTIVLELRQTDTGACQCVGVVFDVETATNEIGRMFFWHKGPIPDHEYRKADRTMSIDEVKKLAAGELFQKKNVILAPTMSDSASSFTISIWAVWTRRSSRCCSSARSRSA